MGQYRKHSISKRARIEHKRREMKRKKALGGLAAFTYSSSVGKSRKTLSKRTGRLG